MKKGLFLQKANYFLPYLFFSLIAFYFFTKHFNQNTTNASIGSALFLVLIIAIFLLQMKYNLNYIDFLLGIATLFWSIWMGLAAFIEIRDEAQWQLNLYWAMILFILCISIYSAVSLLLRNNHKPLT
jgi:DMSO/TMAO reductase YedYZ heme-binding membrane subunit